EPADTRERHVLKEQAGEDRPRSQSDCHSPRVRHLDPVESAGSGRPDPVGKLAGQEGLEPPTCGFGDRRSTIGATGLACSARAGSARPPAKPSASYFVSLWSVCLRHRGQNFGLTSLSVMVRLFLVVV